jgi:hypothetical protein
MISKQEEQGFRLIWKSHSEETEHRHEPDARLEYQAEALYYIHAVLALQSIPSSSILMFARTLFFDDPSFAQGDPAQDEVNFLRMTGYFIDRVYKADPDPCSSDEVLVSVPGQPPSTMPIHEVLRQGLIHCLSPQIVAATGRDEKRTLVLEAYRRLCAENGRTVGQLTPYTTDADSAVDDYLLENLDFFSPEEGKRLDDTEEQKRRECQMPEFLENARCAVINGYQQRQEARGRLLDRLIAAEDVEGFSVLTGNQPAVLGRVTGNKQDPAKYLYQVLAKQDPVFCRRYVTSRGA